MLDFDHLQRLRDCLDWACEQKWKALGYTHQRDAVHIEARALVC